MHNKWPPLEHSLEIRLGENKLKVEGLLFIASAGAAAAAAAAYYAPHTSQIYDDAR